MATWGVSNSIIYITMDLENFKPAHPIRPPRFPAAIAIKYADANDAVTK